MLDYSMGESLVPVLYYSDKVPYYTHEKRAICAMFASVKYRRLRVHRHSKKTKVTLAMPRSF